MIIAKRYVAAIIPSETGRQACQPRYVRGPHSHIEEGLLRAKLFKLKGEARRALRVSLYRWPLRNPFWRSVVLGVMIEIDGERERVMAEEMRPGEFRELLREIPPGH